MHQRRAFAFVLALLGGAFLAAPVAASVDDATASYIVIFRESAVTAPGSSGESPKIDSSRVDQLVAAAKQRSGVSPTNVYANVVGGFSADLSAGQLQALRADPDVGSVTPDTTVSLEGGGPEVQETLVSLSNGKIPAGIKRIGATQNAIAGINNDGGKVNADVAVIDTGIQKDHPDLNVVGGYNCTSTNRSAWGDGNGHGTHVAGIIGALDNGSGVVGVAPGVRLWAVKVMDATGDGLLSWIVCGIDWITAQRSGDGSRPLIDVANMSLRSTLPQGDDGNCGRTDRDALHRALCRSVAAGTVYVVAAGNDHNDAKYYRPSAYNEAITVSAMTDYDGKPGGDGSRPGDCPQGYPDDTWAAFSNFGHDVDLTAPGICVLSTWNGSRYAYASGTSMASPEVAGTAALYRAQYPAAQPQQVKMALQYVAHTDWKRWTDPDGQPDRMVWATDFAAPPDFSVAASAPGTYFGVGSAINVSVSLDRVRGHTAPVTLSMSGLPSSLTAGDVTTSGSSATLQVTVGTYASSGRYTATVTADDGELVHTATVDFRVDASAPTATFSAPTGRIQSTKSAHIVWTESDGGGSGIAGRVLWRQRANPVVPGSCSGLTYYNVGFPRTAYDDYIDPLYNGYCYRWSVTVRDVAGNRATFYSSAVLVDTTPPSKPSVSVVGSTSSVDTVSGVPSAYVDGNGTLWLRGGGSGSVDLRLAATDATSGVSSLILSPTTSTTGWTFPRTVSGDSVKVHFSYTSKAVTLGLSIRARNGAGLSSDAAAFRTVPDATSPSAPSWSTPSSGTWFSPDGGVTLGWGGGSDSGSGLARFSYVRRQRAPVTSTGGCGSWSKDGGGRLLTSGYEDINLPSGYCFRWTVRNVDRVGHVSTAVTSGRVLVDRSAPKVSITKPLPGPTIIKSRTSQTVSWSVTDSGGSKIASVTVQRQRATSHPAGTCDGATWKLDGSARSVVSPLSETGLAAGSCYRWLITARDHATNSTTATTGAVLISSTATSSSETAPTVANLTVTPLVAGRVTSSGMPQLDARWTADGGSGDLTGYELRVSASGGTSWSSYVPPNGVTPQMMLQLPAGRTYLVEVRAQNDEGAWSSWSSPATFSVAMAQGEGSAFQKVGTWKSASLSGAVAGAVTYSTSTGDIVRYSFTGRSVALVSTVGPDRGMADVYIDGYRVTTVDLYSATLVTRQVVFVWNWSSSGTHVVSLQVRSTSGRPRVDVDACVVLN